MAPSAGLGRGSLQADGTPDDAAAASGLFHK